MRGQALRRRILFVSVSAILVAAAFAFAGGGGAGRGPSRKAPDREAAAAAVPPVAAGAVERVRRLLAEARPSARRFLRAFFRYEVGAVGPRVAAALRTAATPGFARRLLAAPPRVPAAGAFSLPAKLGRLRVTFVSAAANRALISGQASRGAAPEEFSFVFVRTAAGWLASGPGE